MMLLDSNIIIYGAQPEHSLIRQFIAQYSPVVSAISCIEVLGFHRLLDFERSLLEQFFKATTVIPISDRVVQKAIELRQRRRMSLGDSIIAATALVHGYTLVTHNTDDFKWLTELSVLDPLDQGG